MKYQLTTLFIICLWSLDAYRLQSFLLSRFSKGQKKTSLQMVDTSPSPSLNTRVHKNRNYSPYKRSLRPDKSMDLDSFHAKQQIRHYSDSLQVFIPNLIRCQQLANEGKIDSALSLFHTIPFTSKCNLLKAEINFFLRELGNRGAIEACVEVFHTLLRAGFQPTLITFGTIISRAGRWKQITIVEKFYQDMLIAKIIPDASLYTSMITAYGKVGRVEKALEFFDLLLSQRIQPTTITCNSLLDACVCSREFQLIPQVLSRCTEEGVQFDEDTFATLINAQCLQRQLDEAEQTLQTMIEKGFTRSIFAYSTLINAYGQRGNLANAFRILEFMRKQGLEPNIVTISSLIHACGKAGELEKAFYLFNRLFVSNEHKSSRHKTNFPNSITCSSLIDCCLKHGEIDRAFDVIRIMHQHHIPMNEVTYTSLITELTKRNELDRMDEALMYAPHPSKKANQAKLEVGKDRKGSGQSGSILASLQTLLKQYQQHDVGSHSKDLLVEVLETMLSHRWLPTPKVIEVVIQGATSLDALNRMTQLVNKIAVMLGPTSNLNKTSTDSNHYDAKRLTILKTMLEEKKKKVNSQTVLFPSSKYAASNATAMFQSYFRANEFDELLDLYLEMKHHQKPVDYAMYDLLIKSICLTAKSSGSTSSFSPKSTGTNNVISYSSNRLSLPQQQLSRLFQLFRDMQEQGIQPDVGVYNSLINGCATAGDIDKALQTLELMRSEGIEPTVITYTSLVQACSMVGGREAIEKGEEIFEAMQQRTNHFSSYVPPNQLTYEQVIYLHLNSGTDRMNTTRINELFRDMMSQHYLVDIPILRSCMKASMAINNIELARVTIEAFAKQQSESDIYNACVNTANEVCRKFGWGSIASFEMLFNLS